DGFGNSATISFQVDYGSRHLHVAGVQTYALPIFGCNPTSSAITAALGSASATDACSTATITFTDGTVSTSSCSSSQTRIFTAVRSEERRVGKECRSPWSRDSSTENINITRTTV